jgi:hypothetical protein
MRSPEKTLQVIKAVPEERLLLESDLNDIRHAPGDMLHMCRISMCQKSFEMCTADRSLDIAPDNAFLFAWCDGLPCSCRRSWLEYATNTRHYNAQCRALLWVGLTMLAHKAPERSCACFTSSSAMAVVWVYYHNTCTILSFASHTGRERERSTLIGNRIQNSCCCWS